MDLKGKIQHYLVQGYRPSEVASMAGCSPAYVSQLLADANFKKQVEERMLEGSSKPEDEQLDEKMEAFEHAAIAALKNNLPEASFRDTLAALDKVSAIRDKRKQAKNPIPSTQVGIAIINLPSQHLGALQAPAVQMNSQREIVQIGGTNLAPLSGQGVKDLFAKLREHKNVQATIAHEI